MRVHFDLRTLKSSKEFKKSNTLVGDLNLFERVVLKSDVSLSDKLNEHLAKKCTTKEKDYCERLWLTLMTREEFCSLLITMVIVLKLMLIFHFTFLKINSNMIFLL